MKASSLVLALVVAGCGETLGHAYLWAGGGEPGLNGDGRPLTESRLYWPIDVFFAPDGTPWVLDWNNHLVRRVTKAGTLETVVGNFLGDGDEELLDLTPAGAPGLEVNLNHPTALAFAPDGTVFIAAWHNHKIRTVSRSGQVHVLCGRDPGFAGDGGPAKDALFNQPKSLVRASDGTLYLNDQRNLRVRRIKPDGLIDTIAGTGTRGFSGDGGDPREAELAFDPSGNPEPSGALALDEERGLLYLADSLNHRIRRIDLGRNVIETIAGTGEAGYGGDDGPALSAKLNNPRDLELSKDGTLYVADSENHVVRAIDLATGRIETVAGTGRRGRGDPGRAATRVDLARPFGVALDPEGQLYVSDTFNNRILRVVRR
jgi:sugar lactone lactonase YvrE